MLNRRIWLSSLVLHAALAGALWLRMRELPISNHQTVFVEIDRGSTAGKAVTGTERGSKPRGTRFTGRFTPISDWGRIFRSGPTPAQGTSEPQVASDGDAHRVARAMNVEKEGQLVAFLDEIWKRLENRVQYPRSFVDNQEQGHVTLQVVVDHQGRFSGELRDVRSDSLGLMSYTAAAVIMALEEPLPRAAWRPDGEQWSLGINFNYKLRYTGGDTVPDSLAMKSVSRMKNWLEFHRDGWTENPVNRAVNEFVGKYFPPIIPVPGGAVIDLVRAYEMIQGYANRGKKPEAADRRKLRRNLDLEEWKTVVRRRSGSGRTS